MSKSTLGNVIHWILMVLVSPFYPYIMIIDKFIEYGINIKKHIKDGHFIILIICTNGTVTYNGAYIWNNIKQKIIGYVYCV